MRIKQDILTNIIDKKIDCVFISPHLDDAILSAGALLSYLADKVRVRLVTVFTESTDGRPTLSARAFIRQTGYNDAKKLFSDRRAEDAKVCQELGVSYSHLGLVDALWRLKRNPSDLSKIMGKLAPEFIHSYPVYRTFVVSKKISVHDNKVIEQITSKLQEVATSRENTIIFCPLAIRSHIDHVIVRNICQKIFDNNLIYWLDFPYSLKVSSRDLGQATNGLEEFVFADNLEKKKSLILKYRTQFPAIFKNKKIPEIAEKYYYQGSGAQMRF